MENDYPMWIWGLYYAVGLFMLVCMWIIYKKANRSGWDSIIPIYNTMVMLKIAGKPMWWIVLMFIPIVNIIFICMAVYDFCKAFGKGLGFFFGVVFLPFIFYPILAFGKAQYTNPNGPSLPSNPTPLSANPPINPVAMPPMNPPMNPPTATAGQ